MEQGTTETTNEAQASIPDDPIPANVRAFMQEHRGDDLSGVMNYIRTNESAKQRQELEEAKSREAETKRKLDELQSQMSETVETKGKKTESVTAELQQSVIELRDIVLKSVEANQQASVGTRRMVMLAQIPVEILPVELHSLVQGSTDEELQQSLSDAINKYRSIASRFAPVEQQQVPQIPGQNVLQPVPYGLSSPQNAGLETESISEPITANTIRELANRAMGGDGEAMAQFQQVAGQVVASRGMG